MYTFRNKQNYIVQAITAHPKADVAFQLAMAPELRRLANQHLANSDSVIGKHFRQGFNNIDVGVYNGRYQGNYRNYLNEQSKDRVWGEVYQLRALAEEFGVNVIVTSVTHKAGKESRSDHVAHKVADENAPTIHLQNINNGHWQHGNYTYGDGNCLYNAFAQAMHAEGKEQFKEILPKVVEVEVEDMPAAVMFKLPKLTVTEKKAVELQAAKFAELLADATSSAELEVEQSEEEARIAKLSVEEQQQIADDHRLALLLALEESEIEVNSEADYVGSDFQAVLKSMEGKLNLSKSSCAAEAGVAHSSANAPVAGAC